MKYKSTYKQAIKYISHVFIITTIIHNNQHQGLTSTNWIHDMRWKDMNPLSNTHNLMYYYWIKEPYKCKITLHSIPQDIPSLPLPEIVTLSTKTSSLDLIIALGNRLLTKCDSGPNDIKYQDLGSKSNSISQDGF